MFLVKKVSGCFGQTLSSAVIFLPLVSYFSSLLFFDFYFKAYWTSVTSQLQLKPAIQLLRVHL